MASSIPANGSSTRKIPIGNCLEMSAKKLPNTNPKVNFARPRSATQSPFLHQTYTALQVHQHHNNLALHQTSFNHVHQPHYH